MMKIRIRKKIKSKIKSRRRSPTLNLALNLNPLHNPNLHLTLSPPYGLCVWAVNSLENAMRIFGVDN